MTVRASRFIKFTSRFVFKNPIRRTKMDIASTEKQRGALIVLEGLDRCGKTLQSNQLMSYFKEKGLPAEMWRFPDRTTGIGKIISSYLANQSHLDDQAVHLLFSANRWEKRSLMEAKLKSGITILIDRYSYSGVAYSAAKGLDIHWCKMPETGLLAPDLLLFLEISPKVTAERGGYGDERYEQLDFQMKVAENYQMLRDHTWKIVDATHSVEDVQKQLRELVFECILACQQGKPLSNLWL